LTIEHGGITRRAWRCWFKN